MIQLLKLTASKLHNRKLKGLTGEELSGLLGEVQARFHLDNVDEAVVFTALFDCGCGGRKNDLNDLVAYFGCTLLQMIGVCSGYPVVGSKASGGTDQQE